MIDHTDQYEPINYNLPVMQIKILSFSNPYQLEREINKFIMNPNISVQWGQVQYTQNRGIYTAYIPYKIAIDLIPGYVSDNETQETVSLNVKQPNPPDVINPNH